MFYDESGSEFEASDEEGENQIVHEFDNEDEDCNQNQEKKLIWSDNMKNDTMPSKEVLFKPSTVIDCFDHFMPSKLKEKIRTYSNMKGKYSPRLIL